MYYYGIAWNYIFLLFSSLSLCNGQMVERRCPTSEYPASSPRTSRCHLLRFTELELWSR